MSGERAAHVAVYGQPIWGADDWRKSIDVRAASQGKLLRTITRATRLQAAWRNLTSFHRVHRAVALRLDAQRAYWLIHRGRVPATAHLQHEWLSLSRKERQRWLAPLSVGVEHLRDVLPCRRGVGQSRQNRRPGSQPVRDHPMKESPKHLSQRPRAYKGRNPQLSPGVRGWRRRELNPIRSLRAAAWKSLIQHQLGSISIPLNPARSIWIRGLAHGRATYAQHQNGGATRLG